MQKKGRYGQFVRGIITFIDLIILNVIYLLVCLCTDIPKEFFTKPVWFMLNLSYMVVIYLFSDIHSKRIVFADKVILNAAKSVVLNAAVFLALLTFVDAPDIHPFVFIKLYLIFFLVLSVWWIGSRKLLKLYRKLGYNFRRIIIIGGGTTGIQLLNELLSDSGYGYKVMGFFDDNKGAKSVSNYIGKINCVEQFVKDNFIDEMYCTISGDQSDTVAQLIKISESNAVDFFLCHK